MPTEFELVEPLPDNCTSLWATFTELHSHRRWSDLGPQPLAFSDIQAYQSVRQVQLEGWEVDAIFRLDNLFLEINSTSEVVEQSE